MTNPELQIELTAAKNANTICDLSHLALIELAGADASTFLQGQVTNDVKKLNGANAHYSGYCNPKGRLLALFLAFSHQQTLNLLLPTHLLEPILKRLKMYVMRSQVSLRHADEMQIFGLNGAQIPQHLAEISPEIPQSKHGLSAFEHGAIIRLSNDDECPRFLLICQKNHAQTLWQTLTKNCQPISQTAWDSIEIKAGIPEIVANTQEQFVPQMLNLDALEAINYQKGCYTGQEIVARTHYLGTVKRRTFLAGVLSDVAPQAGDKILDALQQEAGMVVRAAPNLAQGYDLLLECRLEAQQAGDIFWNTQKLTFKPLPYVL